MLHTDQVLALLHKQIQNQTEVNDILATAKDVSGRWIAPLQGGKAQKNGLIYGLIQSGKTGVLTVTGALGADEGYRAIIVLTSDIDPLYEQTLGRIREAFPGMDVISKPDFKDTDAFLRRVRANTVAIVTTKNAGMLQALIENFEKGNVKGLTCLLIDDEADQASLNTKESRQDGTRSPINDSIAKLRAFFDRNTYLQVTATPQALFLQVRGHSFRPQFTVLSHPGYDYVGGDDFFGDDSQLVREFDIADIDALTAGGQPHAGRQIPRSLLRALDTFMVAATYKRASDPEANCAFLCHVSTSTQDHKHIENLLLQYKIDLADQAKHKTSGFLTRLRVAYDDLTGTYLKLALYPFDKLIEQVAFFAPGISVKVVNGQTDEDVAVRSPYNLFVGGNKLGRGVTIKNLLVSYYGRNPRKPQADTVLQHARMYGYRRKDLGLLRLFLPPELHTVFRAINKMEGGLRALVAQNSSEEFRGVYIEGNLNATRRNVLVPGALGAYSGGSTYNPAQVVRDDSAAKTTEKLDSLLNSVRDKTFVEMEISDIRKLIELTLPDDSQSEHIWRSVAVAESVEQFGLLRKQKVGYVYVDRNRDVRANRRETQGILEGGEAANVPDDKLTLFFLRMRPYGKNEAAWWPQVRFPRGQYAFAFNV